MCAQHNLSYNNYLLTRCKCAGVRTHARVCVCPIPRLVRTNHYNSLLTRIFH